MTQKSPQNRASQVIKPSNPNMGEDSSSNRVNTIDTSVKHERANSTTRNRSYEEHNRKK